MANLPPMGTKSAQHKLRKPLKVNTKQHFQRNALPPKVECGACFLHFEIKDVRDCGHVFICADCDRQFRAQAHTQIVIASYATWLRRIASFVSRGTCISSRLRSSYGNTKSMLTTHSATDNTVQLDLELDLLGLLRRRHPHMLLGVLLGTVLAAIFYLQHQPIYESELSVLVGQRSSELANTGIGNSIDRGTVQDEVLSTHMELFSSRVILDKAIAHMKLDSTVKDFSKNLSVSKGGAGLAKNASVLKATFKDPDPSQAALVLRAIFDSYHRYIEEKSQNLGKEAAALISNSLVESEAALKKADSDYRDFIATIPALIASDGDGLKDVHAMRLLTIEQELATVKQALAQSRSRLEAVKNFARGKKPDQLTDIDVMTLISEEEALRLLAIVNINNPKDKITTEEHQSRETNRISTEVEYRKLLDLISKREQLQFSFGASHPSYRAVVQEINSVQRYIDRARQLAANQKANDAIDNILVSPAQMLVAYANVLNSEIREGEVREKGLIAISEEEAGLAKKTETSYLLSVALKNDLERARSRYDEVFARLQEINLTNSSSGFSTDLIVPPYEADKPVWPSKIKIASLGLLVGGLLGLGLALLAEMTDDTFRNPSEVEQTVGASVLAHIPTLEPPRTMRMEATTSAISPMIATFHDPRGSVAETFRVLRTSVVCAMRKNGKQTLMVTSPSPADGKSTTVANLAVSLAQGGSQVLLVDGDLRRPSLGKMFGITGAIGLTDYLLDGMKLADSCHASEQHNLTFCPSGASISQPADALQSDRLPKFLAEARKRFDIVLIDTPPILAVADPSIVGDAVDGCILIVRIEKNNRTLIDRAQAILSEQGVAVDGVIVNSSYLHRNRYGYSSFNYDRQREYAQIAEYHRYYIAKEHDAPATLKDPPAATVGCDNHSTNEPGNTLSKIGVRIDSSSNCFGKNANLPR